MTETTYYTPEKLEEFKLNDRIEINYPRWICKVGEHYTNGKFVDNWLEDFVSSVTLPQLESWYYDKQYYGDIDLTKRIRIKQQ